MKEEQETKKPQYKNHRSNFVGAFLLIALGLILLLNNFNVLPWGIWEILWKFWPVMLLFWGLEMIFGNGVIGDIIVSVLSITIIFFVISFAVSKFNPNYNNFMMKNFPNLWKYANEEIPLRNFGNGKNKIFRCNPLDNSCEIIYR